MSMRKANDLTVSHVDARAGTAATGGLSLGSAAGVTALSGCSFCNRDDELQTAHDLDGALTWFACSFADRFRFLFDMI